jgi:hypothetical protein
MMSEDYLPFSIFQPLFAGDIRPYGSSTPLPSNTQVVTPFVT